MARETMEATDKLARITASDLSDASLHVQHSYVYIINLCTTSVGIDAQWLFLVVQYAPNFTTL